MSNPVFRPLRSEDLLEAVKLSMEFGWPHQLDDWRFALKVGQGVVAELVGQLVGVTMWWHYGDHVASIGMVIVTGHAQGHGIGRSLMQVALEANPGRIVFLTATSEGAPLYRKLGFKDVSPVYQCQGISDVSATGERCSLRPLDDSDFMALCALDAQAVGYRRPALLEALRLAGACVVSERGGVLTGYAFSRRFGRGNMIGPVAAVDPHTALGLIDHWLFCIGARSSVWTSFAGKHSCPTWPPLASVPRHRF